MGMSASQARMLSLTARLSDLEYQAQSISNSKIRLSQQSEQASTEYSDALDKQKLTVLSGFNSTTGAATYADASAYNLTTYNAVSTLDKQRLLKSSSGQLVISDAVKSAYDSSGGSIETFLNHMGYTSDSSKNGTQVQIQTKDQNGGTATSSKAVKNDTGAITYYTNVFNQIAQNGYYSPGDDNMTNPDWLYSELNGGNIYLQEWNADGGSEGTGAFDSISWKTGDTSLAVKSDDTGTAKAEADYTTKMAQIQTKDKRFDLELKSIDTEHTAIQTEIDSVKKVVDKNIERSFKVFDA